MSRRDLIDTDCQGPMDQLLEVLPGGFNAIPDIVERRAAVEQMLAMMPAPETRRDLRGPDGRRA